jgi:hypothetical protein
VVGAGVVKPAAGALGRAEDVVGASLASAVTDLLGESEGFAESVEGRPVRVKIFKAGCSGIH